MALTEKQVYDLNNAMEANQRCNLGNLIASMETAQEGVATLLGLLTDAPNPVPAGITITGGNKIVTIPYDKSIFTTLSDVDLKAAITWAAGGVTFIALGASDTVVLTDFGLVVTFDVALTGATNKIKIAGNTIVSTYRYGDVLAYTTPAIAAV